MPKRPPDPTHTRVALLDADTVQQRGGTFDARAPGASDVDQQAVLERRPMRFEIEGELGRGGLGTVYAAFDPMLRRRVAIKRLRQVASPRLHERFLHEVRVMGQLEHPNIVPVHDLGVDEYGEIYLVMKLIKGRTLRELIDDARRAAPNPETLTELLQILVKTLDAVGYAHSRGVVHLDIKPSNIMVGAFGEVYLLDWGLARVLDPGVEEPMNAGETPLFPEGRPSGTPGYMPPEQARGETAAIGPAADIFALGAIIHRMLTGRGPYGDGTAADRLERARYGHLSVLDPSDAEPHIPRALLEIARRALALEPADRYPNARAMKKAIEGFLLGTSSLRVRHIRAGETILRQGEPGSTAFVLREGQCRVLREHDGAQIEVRYLYPGDVFGELAVIAGGPRTASVLALTDVTVVEVDASELEAGLGLSSWTSVFIKAVVRRFRELEDRVIG